MGPTEGDIHTHWECGGWGEGGEGGHFGGWGEGGEGGVTVVDRVRERRGSHCGGWGEEGEGESLW